MTNKGIAENLAFIKAAFPKLDNLYFQILKEMIKDENFVDERLKDAVRHTIKTCVYPEPTIANFLSYDKNIKVYTYEQYSQLAYEMGSRAGEFYKSVRLNNSKKPAWVHVNDIEEHNLILWNK